MKKIIKSLENGIIQVTCPDERWYVKEKTDEKTGLPDYEFVPSVTWVTSHYPKGIGFYKYLAGLGWDESLAIKDLAAEKGSRVHLACAMLIDGATIKINDKLPNPETGEPQELSLEEYECIMSFTDWFNSCRPTDIKKDFVVWGDGYAGTVDMTCVIDNVKYLIDFKTSQSLWPSHEIQVSAYKKCLPEIEKTAILQIGYKKNKQQWKFTETEDKYDLFLAAKTIWANETANTFPFQRDYPIEVCLTSTEKKEIKHGPARRPRKTAK